MDSPLRIPLNPDAILKKTRASKVPIHLQDKTIDFQTFSNDTKYFHQLLKNENPFINPVIILAKDGSLTTVLHPRCLNSLIDEPKSNGPIEPIKVKLTKTNGKDYTTTDINSAYKKIPLEKQSRRLRQFVIENQQYEIIRRFYDISTRPAGFLPLWVRF